MHPSVPVAQRVAEVFNDEDDTNPTPDFGLLTLSINSMRQFTSSKAGFCDQFFAARVETVRLVVSSVIEGSLHVLFGGVSLASTAVLLPFTPFGAAQNFCTCAQMTWVSVSHLIRLAVAVPFAILFGIVYPKASCAVYERLGLVNEPEPELTWKQQILKGVWKGVKTGGKMLWNSKHADKVIIPLTVYLGYKVTPVRYYWLPAAGLAFAAHYYWESLKTVPEAAARV